jgi:cytoskeletal protein CcmA (bactofilin family)
MGTLATSTIGEDLTVTGNVISKGEIHVEGHVNGDVRCVSLVLGENSEVRGNVVAEDVVIRGRLVGSVRALSVMLQATSHVEGDLLHKSLAIEQGAYFEGKACRAEDPLSQGQEESVAAEPEPEPGAAKSDPVAERPEPRKGQSTTRFSRSFPESRKAN